MKISRIADISPHIEMQIEKAVSIMREGGVVAFPTDTIYGLGCDLYNEKAIERVFRIKRRPTNLPLPILIEDLNDLLKFSPEPDETVTSIANIFWPGALTIIVKTNFSSAATAGSGKIGLRIPDHPVPRLMINMLGNPIIGTSANLHDHENTLAAQEVSNQLGDQVDFLIDTGICPGGIESTILDCTVFPPKVIRQGLIKEQEILDAIAR